MTTSHAAADGRPLPTAADYTPRMTPNDSPSRNKCAAPNGRVRVAWVERFCRGSSCPGRRRKCSVHAILINNFAAASDASFFFTPTPSPPRPCCRRHTKRQRAGVRLGIRSPFSFPPPPNTWLFLWRIPLGFVIYIDFVSRSCVCVGWVFKHISSWKHFFVFFRVLLLVSIRKQRMNAHCVRDKTILQNGTTL